MQLTALASIATIIGVPIGILTLIFTYKSLRKQMTDVNNKVSTISEIINLHFKYFASGSQYSNCNFYGSPQDSKQIFNEFTKEKKMEGQK